MSQHPDRKELDDWPTIQTATKRAEERVGVNSAMDALWERIRNGFIRTYAMRWSHQLGEYGAPHPETDPRLLDTQDWAQYQSRKPATLWRGEATFVRRERVNTPTSYMKCVDIRVDPKELEREFPKPAPLRPEPAITAEIKGGRRPAWWREPILTELAGQLYDGDLKPKKLADLEAAAHDWLGKQGEYPAERTVRNVVTSLWERISKEGKNSKG